MCVQPGTAAAKEEHHSVSLNVLLPRQGELSSHINVWTDLATLIKGKGVSHLETIDRENAKVFKPRSMQNMQPHPWDQQFLLSFGQEQLHHWRVHD